MMESEKNVVYIHVFYKCPWQRRQGTFLNERTSWKHTRSLRSHSGATTKMLFSRQIPDGFTVAGFLSFDHLLILLLSKIYVMRSPINEF